MSISVVLLVLMEHDLVSLLEKELVLLVLHVVVIGICRRGSVLWPLVSKMLMVILPLIAVGVTFILRINPDFRSQIVPELVVHIIVVHLRQLP